MIKPLFCSVALAASMGAAAQQPPAMLVLDASGSMWGRIDGRSKVEIARDAVGRLAERWNADVPLGLVAYGHRRTGDCADIETLLAPAPLDRAAFVGKVGALNAKGMTPLSAAVLQAADALGPTGTVILLSDGEETCKLDPCEVGRQLEQKDPAFTVHVIGFDVPNPAHQAQLRCLADTTGGRYFSARNAEDLAGTLATLAEASSAPALPPATATLEAPDSVVAATTITVRPVDAPNDDGDYIALVDPALPTHDITYGFANTDGLVLLAAPAKPGRYELRYVSPRRTEPVLGTRPIAVTEVSGSIEAPASVAAGSTVSVIATGPVARGHWIGFAPKDSPAHAYLDYARPTGPRSEVTLRAPTEPGSYELRYVLNESERVLASRPIEVGAATASVRGPASVEAGGVVEVEALGPAGNGNWVGFAPVGSDADAYLGYADLEDGQTRYALDVPTTAGGYELRVVMANPATVVASQPITVTPAQASISGPATVTAGSEVTVQARGPNAPGSWVGFAPAGSEDAAYLDFRYVEEGVGEYTLTAPEAPGRYELRYVLRESTVIARQAVTVE